MPGYEWSGDCAEDPSQCDEDGFSLWNHGDGAIFFPDDACSKRTHHETIPEWMVGETKLIENDPFAPDPGEPPF